jgi:hypothetical protein
MLAKWAIYQKKFNFRMINAIKLKKLACDIQVSENS